MWFRNLTSRRIQVDELWGFNYCKQKTAIEGVGATVRPDPTSGLWTVNEEFTASLVISRSLRTAAGSLRWKIRLDTGLNPDVTIAARMDALNRDVMDYYLLPRLDLGAVSLRLAEDNRDALDAYRCDSLEPLLRLTERTSIRSAA